MRYLTIPLVALLAGCATVPNGRIVDSGPIRSDGQAMLDQPTRVGNVVVTPKKVVEDSRCPINARCIWAGRVVLTTRIDGAGWRETVNLTLGEPATTHGVGLALTLVEPGKIAGSSAPPAPYTFGFKPR